MRLGKTITVLAMFSMNKRVTVTLSSDAITAVGEPLEPNTIGVGCTIKMLDGDHWTVVESRAEVLAMLGIADPPPLPIYAAARDYMDAAEAMGRWTDDEHAVEAYNEAKDTLENLLP